MPAENGILGNILKHIAVPTNPAIRIFPSGPQHKTSSNEPEPSSSSESSSWGPTSTHTDNSAIPSSIATKTETDMAQHVTADASNSIPYYSSSSLTLMAYTTPLDAYPSPLLISLASQTDTTILGSISQASHSTSPTQAGASQTHSSKHKTWIVAPALLIPTFIICVVFLTLYLRRRRNGMRNKLLRRMRLQLGMTPKGVEYSVPRVKEGVMVSVDRDVHVDSQEALESTPMFRDGVSTTHTTKSESGS